MDGRELGGRETALDDGAMGPVQCHHISVAREGRAVEVDPALLDYYRNISEFRRIDGESAPSDDDVTPPGGS